MPKIKILKKLTLYEIFSAKNLYYFIILIVSLDVFLNKNCTNIQKNKIYYVFSKSLSND